MGTAKKSKIKNFNGFRTFTVIGTPQYMAPEIISGNGYNYAVDLWSLGIMVYEFVCGMLPFGENLNDPYEIYEEIINTKKLVFPKYLGDKYTKLMIQKLLSKAPELRLGGSYALLKANPWFNKFDWDNLFDKEMKPAFIPKIESLSTNDIENISKSRENLSFLQTIAVNN